MLKLFFQYDIEVEIAQAFCPLCGEILATGHQGKLQNGKPCPWCERALPAVSSIFMHTKMRKLLEKQLNVTSQKPIAWAGRGGDNKLLKPEIFNCYACGGLSACCSYCGNNACNGGSGTWTDGQRCLFCDDAYQIQNVLGGRDNELNKLVSGILAVDYNFIDEGYCASETKRKKLRAAFNRRKKAFLNGDIT